ncbi:MULTISPECIES: hypothetical protein [unclassified Frankia]
MAEDARPGAVRVRQTGIALVHAGELVLPAAGSEAELEPAAVDPRAVVEYHFPVVIEVREAQAPDVEAIAKLAARHIVRGLRD